jgi:hypothetical protein
VKVTLGDRDGESRTTVKAELRRWMLERVHTASGKFVTRTFVVNIRTPQISTGGAVQLKDREFIKLNCLLSGLSIRGRPAGRPY